MDIKHDPQSPEPTPFIRQKSKHTLMSVALIVALGGVGLILLQGKEAPIGKSVDFVSSAAEFARETAFASLKPVNFTEIAPAQIPSAVSSMGLNQADQAALLQASAHGVKLTSVVLYDSDAEDGDVVTVTSNGFARRVVLQKQLATIVIPEPQSGFFTLTGTVDGGGGGVTVGIILPSGPTPLPVMSVGQTLTIPAAGQGVPFK